ncbi:MAG: sugar phosphate isomerase/epimerase family protein [Armatimonadota bacterium]
MKCAIRENLMGHDLTIEEKFRRAADLGFDGIELIPKDNPQMHGMMVFEEDGRDELRGLSEEYSLAISSLSLGIYREANCLTTDADEWEAGKEMLRSAIEAATELDCAGILLPHFGPMEPDLDDPRLEPDLRGIREAIEESGNTELVMAVECTVDLETMQRVIEIADHPQVGIYFDMGNLKNNGFDPVAMIRALGTEGVKMVHAKEAGAQLLGDGEVDLQDVADALREIGYDEWIAFETAPTDDPIAAIEHNFEVLRRYI